MSPSPGEGTRHPPCGCSSAARGGQLCTNPLQAPICIFFFFYLPLFWLGNQPCPPYPPQKLDVPQGHGVPICASGTPPQLLSPAVLSSAATSSLLPASCQFPSAAAGTFRQNCPFLAPFSSIWHSFPWAWGGGTQQEPCDGHRGGTGLAPSPHSGVGTRDTAAGGVVRVQRGLGGVCGCLFAPQGRRWHWGRWWHPPGMAVWPSGAPWATGSPVAVGTAAGLWWGHRGDGAVGLGLGMELAGSGDGPRGLRVPVPSPALPPSPPAPGSATAALDVMTSPRPLLLGDTQDVTPLSLGKDTGRSLEGWGSTCRISAGTRFIPSWEFASRL